MERDASGKAIFKHVTERRRCEDPIHDVLTEAKEFIEQPRYYSAKNHEDALLVIEACRAVALRRVVRREMDGFDLKRIDSDAERLIQRSKGRLFGSMQRMQDREAQQRTNPAKQPKRSISLDELRSRLDRQITPQQ